MIHNREYSATKQEFKAKFFLFAKFERILAYKIGTITNLTMKFGTKLLQNQLYMNLNYRM